MCVLFGSGPTCWGRGRVILPPHTHAHTSSQVKSCPYTKMLLFLLGEKRDFSIFVNKTLEDSDTPCLQLLFFISSGASHKITLMFHNLKQIIF